MALVKFASSINMELVERDRTFVQLLNCKGQYENYEILANFPFSSASKKMSVLVRHRETGKIIYYVKGAEVVMETIIQQNQRASLLEFCESLAMEGLRTLVFGQKLVSEEEYAAFDESFRAAQNSVNNREMMI